MAAYDAIVVGAGPAGSTCAYRLASGGASVLLLDKARFPRDKPCGGGLTFRAVKELPFSVDPVVEEVVNRVECRLRYGRSFVRGYANQIGLDGTRRGVKRHDAEIFACDDRRVYERRQRHGSELDRRGQRAWRRSVARLYSCDDATNGPDR